MNSDSELEQKDIKILMPDGQQESNVIMAVSIGWKIIQNIPYKLSMLMGQ